MPKSRILIIEDEVVIADLLCEILSDPKYGGYEAQSCGSAEEGIEWLAQGRFDLLICDNRLPGMDGLALLEQIQPTQDGMKTILMTAFWSEEVEIQGKKLADAFISKPFSFLDFIETVQVLLNDSSQKP